MMLFGPVAALFALAGISAAHAESYSVSTPNYAIFGTGSPDDLIKVATRLEIVRSLLESQVGRIPPAAPNARMTVLVVGDADDVNRLCGPQCAPELIGFARGTQGGLVAVTSKRVIGSGDYGAQYVLFSIVAMDAVGRKFPPGAPQWLKLGWAEMVASTNFAKPGKLPLGIVQVFRRLQSRQLRWSNLREILDGTATSAKDDRLVGQAMMLTHYLLFAPPRRGQLGAYTSAIMSGKSGAEAAQNFGDLDKLGSELRAYDDSNGLAVRTLPMPDAPAGIGASPIPDEAIASIRARISAGRR